MVSVLQKNQVYIYRYKQCRPYYENLEYELGMKRLILSVMLIVGICIECVDISKLKQVDCIEELSCDSVKLFPHFYEKSFILRAPKGVSKNLIDRLCTGTYEKMDFFNSAYMKFPFYGKAYIATLNKVSVAPLKGTIYDDKQQIVFNTKNRMSWEPEYDLYEKIDDTDLNRPVIRFKKMASVTQRYGNAYYHWMTEILPRITLLLGDLRSDPEIKLLISSHKYSYVEETLKTLGISENQYVYANGKYIYATDKLLFPTPSFSGKSSREGIKRTRDILVSRFENTNVSIYNDRDKVVFIRRKHVSVRKINNFEDLIRSFVDVNPKLKNKIIVFNGDEGLEKTIEIFRSARLVVGSHGAGLANVMFCCPGTKVIEFMPEKSINLCFWNLCNAAELDHWFILVPNKRWEDNYDVSIEDFVDTLDKALK